MKKRVLALILCFVLMAMMLVSCGETDYDKSKEYMNTHTKTPEKEYVTLNLYIPADGQIDESVVADMQAEFNTKYAQKDDHTRVVFHLIDSTNPEASYSELLAEKARIAKEQKDAGGSDNTTTERDGNFPKEKDAQFDIFVSLNLNMLQNMLANDYVLDVTDTLTKKYPSILNNELSETSIATVIYKNAKVDSKYYGVPANFLIGNYTYHVFNREFYEFYHGKGIPNDHLISNVTIDDLSELKKAAGTTAYDENHIVLSGTTANPITYATRFEIGERAEVQAKAWEDYVYIVTETPTLNYEELFNGMYCVSSTCAYPDRALEVIAAIFTDASLHTTLQYGASGRTYTLSDNVVTPIEGAPLYRINTRYTGNILALYPMAEAAIGTKTGFTSYAIGLEFVKYAVKQNADAKYAQSAN